ncbi:MAG: ChaN family lipoprotein [Syntrophothermus sp.]
MKHRILLLCLVSIIALAAKNDKPAYRIFNNKGKTVSYQDMLETASKADIILFGESHTDPVCHWLEFELTKDLYELKGKHFVLGAEMFERDNQLLLDEYVSKKMIRKKDFEAEAKLWKNYTTDYAPIVDFAAEKGIRFVGTNVPRRYAALVNLSGFEGLDSINAYERALIAPLPIKYNPDLKSYKEMANMAGPSHSSPNIAKAQALKDATMAYFIMKNCGEGYTFLHFNGSYHSEDYEGIVWYLNDAIKRLEIPLKVMTIATIDQDTIEDLKDEYKGKADFILCTPSSLTRTN